MAINNWINNDSLELVYGTDKARVNPLGEYRYDGPVRVCETKFTYKDLPKVADNSVVIRDILTLPKGAVIERVEIQTFEAFDSDTDGMLFNLGLINTDRTNGAAATALIDAATQTELNTGGTNIAGWVGAGVKAAPLTVPKLITWEVDVKDATAGEAAIRVFYSVP